MFYHTHTIYRLKSFIRLDKWINYPEWIFSDYNYEILNLKTIENILSDTATESSVMFNTWLFKHDW